RALGEARAVEGLEGGERIHRHVLRLSEPPPLADHAEYHLPARVHDERGEAGMGLRGAAGVGVRGEAGVGRGGGVGCGVGGGVGVGGGRGGWAGGGPPGWGCGGKWGGEWGWGGGVWLGWGGGVRAGRDWGVRPWIRREARARAAKSGLARGMSAPVRPVS